MIDRLVSFWVLCFAISIFLTKCNGELIQNGGFENQMDPWHCWGYSCDVISDSFSGSHALRVQNRTQWYQGPSQSIAVSPGKTYVAQGHVKMLNTNASKLGQNIQLEVSFKYPDSHMDYLNVGNIPLTNPSDGWFLVKGDFQAPTQNVEASFYFQGPDPGIDFLVDEISVTEVAPNPNWRQETDKSIDLIRKSDINIGVHASSGIDKSQLRIQVLQTKKDFPFGCEVDAWKYSEPTQQKYRDFIHNHFNWVVLGNALKWRQFDWHQHGERPNDPLYPTLLNALTGLTNAGLNIRAHNMVWSVKDYIPESVKAQSGDQLKATVKNHINYVMNATKRFKLKHWDVNNENLHGQWFQERLQDRDYDLELFRMMYNADPTPKLFLNDYNVVAQGATTAAYLNQINRYKQAQVHLYGVGVQSHFNNNQEPNPTMIKNHLDTLAAPGYPLWSTELTVSTTDENLRGAWYVKALRALYAHPAIEGIMFWSWQGQSSGTEQFVIGDDMQLNAAGRAVMDLLENEWMTDESRDVATSGDHFNIRGFHGDYQVKVFYQGQERQDLRQSFSLHKGNTKHVNIQI